MIVLYATEWSPRQGGINAFNLGVGGAIAKISNKPVVCVVTAADDAERRSASTLGVELVVVDGDLDKRPTADGGAAVLAAARELGLPASVDLWVGHDLITGFAAASAAEANGGTLALVHHMDYGSYQNLGGGAGDRTARNKKLQAKLFSTPDAIVFGVGE